MNSSNVFWEPSGKSTLGGTSRISPDTQHYIHTASAETVPMGRQQLWAGQLRSIFHRVLPPGSQKFFKERLHVVHNLVANLCSYGINLCVWAWLSLLSSSPCKTTHMQLPWAARTRPGGEPCTEQLLIPPADGIMKTALSNSCEAIRPHTSALAGA